MHRRNRSAPIATVALALALLSGPAAHVSGPVAHAAEGVAPPEQLGFDPGRLQRVTNTFRQYVDTGELPGAVVLIARDGKIAYLQAFGFQDREKQVAMAANSIFRIASM